MQVTMRCRGRRGGQRRRHGQRAALGLTVAGGAAEPARERLGRAHGRLERVSCGGGSADQSSPSHLDPARADSPVRHAGSRRSVMPTIPTIRLRRLLPVQPPTAGPAGLRAHRRPVRRPRRRSATRSSPPATTGARSAGCPTPRSGCARAPGRWPSAGTSPGSGTARRASPPSRRACSTPCTTCPTSSARCSCSPTWPALSTRRDRPRARASARPRRASAWLRPRPRRSARAPAPGRRESCSALESLAPIAEATALPAPAVDRAQRPASPPAARRDRRRRTPRPDRGRRPVRGDRGGSSEPAAAPSRRPAPRPVTEAMLLSPAQVQDLAPRAGVAPARHLGQHLRHRDQHRLPGDAGSPTRAAAARSCASTPPPARRDGTYLETVEVSRSAAGRAGGVPDDARLVRRLQPGPAPAARRLPRAAGSATRRRCSSCASPTRCAAPTSSGSPAPARVTVSTVSETLGGRPVAVRPHRHGADRGRAQPLRRRPVRHLPDDRHGRRRCCRRRPARRPARSRPPTCPSSAAINRPWVGTKPGPGAAQRRGHDLRQGQLRPGRRAARGHPHLPDPAGEAAQALRHHRDLRRLPPPRAGARLRAPASRRRWRRARRRTSAPRSAATVVRAAGLPRLGVRPVAAGQRDQRRARRWASGWASPGWAATSPR